MPLQAFAPGLWIAEGAPITAALGFRYPIRMAVLRVADGGLLVWSPVQPVTLLLAEIALLGPVRALIAPNRLHHVFLTDWAAHFPQARIHAAPGLAAKRPELRLTDLTDTPPPDWDGIEMALVPNSIAAEAVLFHRPSATVLLCDLLQNMPAEWYHGWRGLIAQLDRMTEPEPTLPRKFRLSLGRAARAPLGRVLDWPAQRVLMAHGTPVAEGGQAFLRRAFSGLHVAA